MRSLVLALAGVLAGAPDASAQGSRKDDMVINARGVPQAGAFVAICAQPANTSTTPCSPLANIYSNAALTQALVNPITTDGLGNYLFYAAPGKYTIQIYGPGITTKVMTDVILPNDPSSPSFTTITTTSGIAAFSLTLTGDLTVSGAASAATLTLSNQSSAPSTPAAGKVVLYSKTDKKLYSKDDAGVELLIGAPNPGNGVHTVDGSTYATIQAAVNAANAASPKGMVVIPPNYAGTDTHTNAGGVGIVDQRRLVLSGPQLGVFDATAYGAKPDGVTNNKQALLDAVTAASNAGGGVVDFPPTTPVTANGYLFNGPVDLVALLPTNPVWITIRFRHKATFNGPSADIVAATGASRAANVVTITTTVVHGLTNGQKVHVTDVTDKSFNGVFVITSIPTTTTFTYAQTGANATSGGGTASTPGLILTSYTSVEGGESIPTAFVNFGKIPVTPISGTAGPIIYAGGRNPLYFSNIYVVIPAGTNNRRGIYLEACTNITYHNVHVSATDPANSNHIPLEIEGGTTSFGHYFWYGGYSGVTTNVTNRPSIWLHNGKGNWTPVYVYFHRTYVDNHGVLAEAETGNSTGVGGIVMEQMLYETTRDALLTLTNPIGTASGNIVMIGNDMADNAFGNPPILQNNIASNLRNVTMIRNVPVNGNAQLVAGSAIPGLVVIGNDVGSAYPPTPGWVALGAVEKDSDGTPLSTMVAAEPIHALPGIAHGGIYGDMATPTGAPTLVVQAGGSLAVGTYSYKVTARDAFGEETVPGPCSASATTTSGNQTIQVTFTSVTGATNYRLYRFPNGTCVGGTTTQFNAASSPFTDTGAGGIFPRDPGTVTLAGAAKIAPAAGGLVAAFGAATFSTAGGLTVPTLVVNGDSVMTAAPRAVYSAFLPGALTATWTGAALTLDKAISVIRVQVQTKTAPAGCATNAVVRVSDGTTSQDVTISAASNDSGSIIKNYGAAAALTVAVQTAASGCTTSPADANVVVQYRMQ